MRALLTANFGKQTAYEHEAAKKLVAAVDEASKAFPEQADLPARGRADPVQRWRDEAALIEEPSAGPR